MMARSILGGGSDTANADVIYHLTHPGQSTDQLNGDPALVIRIARAHEVNVVIYHINVDHLPEGTGVLCQFASDQERYSLFSDVHTDAHSLRLEI
jgi:hypothetical protein